MRRHFSWLGALTLVISTAMSGQGAAATQMPLTAAAAGAAREFGVPVAVILAVSWSETGWVDHGASPSYANGFGVMHLQDNIYNRGLLEAATLLGMPVNTIKADLVENVRAGAALLRRAYLRTYADDQQLGRASNLNRWYLPVAKYLHSDQPTAMRNYADSVFEALARGAQRRFPAGVIRLTATPGLLPLRGDLEYIPNDYMIARQRARSSSTRAGAHLAKPLFSPPEYGADNWDPSPNYTSGRAGYSISEVVIHDCEGSFSGCVTTLKDPYNPKGNVSAHFVVRDSDGYRTQLVLVENTAWHATSHNSFSIGIEHEGMASANPTWYTKVMYRQSAWLSAWACTNVFGCDRNHIVGHSEIDSQKGDPGSYWDWSYYMTCVVEHRDYILYSSQPQFCY